MLEISIVDSFIVNCFDFVPFLKKKNNNTKTLTNVMLQIVITHSASKAMKYPIADINNLPELQLVLQRHVLNKLSCV